MKPSFEALLTGNYRLDFSSVYIHLIQPIDGKVQVVALDKFQQYTDEFKALTGVTTITFVNCVTIAYLWVFKTPIEGDLANGTENTIIQFHKVLDPQEVGQMTDEMIIRRAKESFERVTGIERMHEEIQKLSLNERV